MKKPILVSLYTGAGGLDLGLEAAGFETRVAVEFDADSAATLRKNRDWPVFERDIHDVRSGELLAAAGIKEGEADLLAGGPPCQPFSKSGYWARGDVARLDDPRASTLEAYLRVLRDIKPKVFLLENVAGLAYRQKDEGLQLLDRTIREINRTAGTRYSFVGALLNAADYGVPQERERFFIVGHRDGMLFDFPKPTHSSRNIGSERQGSLLVESQALEPFTTAWDALGDLDHIEDRTLKVTGKWADLLPSIPEGQNYLFHTDRGEGLALFGWRRRYWSFLLKLSKRQPSWTITAQPGSAIGPFHWRNRRLSAHELCRLQTFPDGYEIVGSRVSYQRQLGNAVPSALAEVIGLSLAKMLGYPTNLRPRLVPGKRLPVPRRHPVQPVPQKYLELVGEHEAHPGTGKGYGALMREEQSR